MTYQEILKDLRNKIYHPVYFLCGEEPFYIDKISDYIEANALDEIEKEFNYSVFYGMDSDVQQIISSAKRFPMMSTYQLIVVKEAQNLKKREELTAYVQSPLSSTILVICHKYKKPDERKEFGKTIKKNSVYFNSEKIKDWKVGDWINDYVQEEGLKIGTKSAALLAEFLGNDLAKIANEIEKLKILLPAGAEITPDVIQKNIGISKDYNIFELQNALGEKQILKANQIVDYFGKNEKTHNILSVIPQLYSFFSKILRVHYLKDKSEKGLAAGLGIHPFIAKDYLKYSKNYPPGKLTKIVEHLQTADLRAKGVETTGMEGGQIMKELIFKILH